MGLMRYGANIDDTEGPPAPPLVTEDHMVGSRCSSREVGNTEIR
jgi:hypothetical protein